MDFTHTGHSCDATLFAQGMALKMLESSSALNQSLQKCPFGLLRCEPHRRETDTTIDNRYAIGTLALSSRRLMQWLLHLGGLGLILLGLLDSSLAPVLPGSMDVATMILAARDERLWFCYAAMATVGSVLGGLITYRLGRKGGNDALEKKLRGKNVQKIYKRFERWGFVGIAVAALLPPPVPLFPIVVAAGAAQYPLTRFLTALTFGRLVRYTILAFLAARYGAQILTAFSHLTYAILFAAIGLIVLVVVLFFVISRCKRRT